MKTNHLFLKGKRSIYHILLGSLLSISSLASLSAQVTGVPELSSRPGAAYTIYLDVAGFNYDGLWHDHETAPGYTPAVNRDASTSSGAFNEAEQGEIKKMWARLAQSYTGFDVNVTTIDPAVAAGMATNDAQRQAFYDATPNLMHTIVGSQERADGTPGLTSGGKWYSDDADGVSPGFGVAAGNDPTASGKHTNWMFSEAQAGMGNSGLINGDYIGAIAAHENGHSFGLLHQGDYAISPSSGEPVNEYTNGDSASGNGSYVAIMGNASDRQRVAWRDGTAHEYDEINDTEIQRTQNDVKTLLTTNTAQYATDAGRTGGVDLHFVDDGIGHNVENATVMGVNPDGTVNYVLASGVIVPNSESDPQALGSNNYTEDYFSFETDGVTTLTLTLNNSTQYLQPGVADGVGTFRGLMAIYSLDGSTLLFEGIEAEDTLTNTFSGILTADKYLVKISSKGGHEEDSEFQPASYFEMGGYFLTGSGFLPVPEPSSALLLLTSLGLFFIRRR